MATNLTEGGTFERNLLTRRWEAYSKEILVIKKKTQPKKMLDNIEVSIPLYFCMNINQRKEYRS